MCENGFWQGVFPGVRNGRCPGGWFTDLPSQRSYGGDFPDRPVVRNSELPMQGVWVWSLVGKLRSCMMRGEAKKKKKDPLEAARLGWIVGKPGVRCVSRSPQGPQILDRLSRVEQLFCHLGGWWHPKTVMIPFRIVMKRTPNSSLLFFWPSGLWTLVPKRGIKLRPMVLKGHRPWTNHWLLLLSRSLRPWFFFVVVVVFETLLTVAHQAPLSLGFSRQEHWSGLPFRPPGNLPDPGIKLTSPALAGRFFTTEPPGKSLNY